MVRIRKRSLLPSAARFAHDPRDAFIADVVREKSFCDVGGLWGTTSEKVSVAAAAGATRLAMLDVTAPGGDLWHSFHERLATLDVTGVECISADITATAIDDCFDVVHCSGVIYHVPSPVDVLSALRRVASEYLILTSVVLPEKIRNKAGEISVSSGQALFVPHLANAQLAVLKQHLRDVGIKGAAGLDIPVERWLLDDYGPWWWLFSPSVLRQMLAVSGFEVLEEAPSWGGKARTYLARSS